MRNMSRWSQPAALLSLLAIAAGGLQVTATAVPAPGTPNLRQDDTIAQNTANLCRKVTVQQGLLVRETAAPNSRLVGGVAVNTQVTVAQAGNSVKGPDGRLWMEITSPVKGYVSTGYPNRQTNLAMCSGTVSATPQTTAPATTGTSSSTNLCRQVDPRVKQGVVIRADASGTSALKGGVEVNGKITLVENFKAVPDKNGDNREWVQITSPVAGFVATNNLIMCR